MPLDQPGGPGGVPGSQRVAHCVVGQPVLLAPGRRGPVQRRDPAGLLLLLQPGAQQVGEQVVVAPPAAHLIQRHQEQVRPLHPLQHHLATGTASDRITQPAAEALQHRGLQQELAHLVGLAIQHLVGQVVQDVAVAAAEGRHKPGGIRLSLQRQGGQLQAGRPAFGAGRQRHHRRGGQDIASRFPQQRGRLLSGEPQIVSAQLGKLPAGPQPRQRQRRIGPAGQHQVHARGQVLEQERNRLVHLLGVDQVVVVENQQQLILAGRGGQLVDQRRHQPLERCWCRRAQQRAHPLGDARPRPVQRRDCVPPKPRRVIVTSVQRQPGHRPVAPPGPAGQQGRLAEPGRGAHQDQPPYQPLIERLHQPRAGHKARLQARHVQLGGQQHIPLRSSNPRMGRRR